MILFTCDCRCILLYQGLSGAHVRANPNVIAQAQNWITVASNPFYWYRYLPHGMNAKSVCSPCRRIDTDRNGRRKKKHRPKNYIKVCYVASHTYGCLVVLLGWIDGSCQLRFSFFVWAMNTLEQDIFVMVARKNEPDWEDWTVEVGGNFQGNHRKPSNYDWFPRTNQIQGLKLNWIGCSVQAWFTMVSGHCELFNNSKYAINRSFRFHLFINP